MIFKEMKNVLVSMRTDFVSSRPVRLFVNYLKYLFKRSPLLYSCYKIWKYHKSYNMQAVMTPLGFKFSGNRSMQDGSFEPEETKLFQSLIDKFDVFVNVGANIGYYCCIALKESKEIIAFEPVNTNMQILLKNIHINSGKERKISVFPVALSNTNGFVEIYGEGTGASLISGWAENDYDTGHLVPKFRLDYLIADKLKGRRVLILVDIEGAEKYMLQGADNILNQDPKPIWIIEISINECQPKHIAINPNLLSTFKLFWEAGYVCRTADKERKLIMEDKIVKIVETGVNSLACHNFLFYEEKLEQDIFV